MDKETEYGGVVITVKAGESVQIGDSVVSVAKVAGHGVGKGAVRIHVKARKEIPVFRIKKDKPDVV